MTVKRFRDIVQVNGWASAGFSGSKFTWCRRERERGTMGEA